jgi:hypothetical protein
MFLELFQRYASWKVAAALSLASIPAAYIYRYRRSIKKRLKELEDPVDILIRVKDTSAGEGRFRVLELNPDFVKLHSDKWKLQSIGHYLSTLQPSSDLPDAPEFVRREMDSFLAGMLLHQLGPNIGAAILPLLGFPNIQSTTAKIAARVANWFASRFIVDAAAKEDPALDKGIIPFSLYDLSSFANLNQTLRENTMDTSPVDYLKQGEVYSPSFQSANLIPNPFVVEEHWDKAIQGMEELLRKAHEQDASAEGDETPAYDPHDRSMPKPTPFNQRLFPDLYLGWGSAKCTHTKREIICNKLLCVLLNRLSHNYFKIEQANAEQLFVVKLKSKEKHDIITAQDLVEALFESGHTIEVCPRASLTTFGVAACIKEDDGSWTNIPLAYFFKTGYENPKARAAHVCVPHGGMDLSISGGPLVGDAKCNIQFYMAIEGMAGWHSNHNADVPWVVPTSATEPYSKEGALRAVRMASFLAVTFNALGTELNLPFGGYGYVSIPLVGIERLRCVVNKCVVTPHPTVILSFSFQSPRSV